MRYGETWVEKTINTGSEYLPYKFTGKEQDEETGLYYYGARYLDPKYSRWISTDPALGEYLPQAPVHDDARKHNQNLPGMGGIYNTINSNLYHYAGNNPVKCTDPAGKFDFSDFYSGIKDLFTSRNEKYSQFNDYKIDRFIDENEFQFYYDNPQYLDSDQDLLYMDTNKGTQYCIETLTDFGKMAKEEKFNTILNEYNKALDNYNNLKSDYKSSLTELGYGTGEVLFNIGQMTSIEEFALNYLGTNAETIADIGQIDIDLINTLKDLKFLDSKLNCLQDY